MVTERVPTTHTTVHLPPVAALLRKAAVPLLESTLIPLGLFYLLFTLVGLDGALFAALGWSILALGRRLVLRKQVPAVLWLTTTLLVVRTAIGYWTGSVFLYFLQPTAQNFFIMFALLATLPLKRPLLSKLADDFGVIPDTLSGHPHLQRFFKQVSLLWALVFMVNGVTTLAVLATQTVGNFLMVSTAGSWLVVGTAIGVSMLWFRRSMRSHGIALRLKLRWRAAAA